MLFISTEEMHKYELLLSGHFVSLSLSRINSDKPGGYACQARGHVHIPQLVPFCSTRYNGYAIQGSREGGICVTRRSHSRVLIYLNRAPTIKQFSKKLNTFESSAFGSRFVAIEQVAGLTEGLRYKVHGHQSRRPN